MPPIETEPIDSDSDDEIQFEEAPQPEPSRTPPRHHHHHRRHHRHHQNHHRDSDNMDGMSSEQMRDKRTCSPAIQTIGTPTQPPPSHDEDSRMSLVSEPEKTSGSNFVPFAMGGSGNRNSDHNTSGNKTPTSPNSGNNIQQSSQQSKKKTRMDVKDVFNNDDDDDGTNNSKKRKLVPLGNYYFFKLMKYFRFHLFIFNKFKKF